MTNQTMDQDDQAEDELTEENEANRDLLANLSR